MIRSILNSDIRRFVERGKSRFSGLDTALAFRRLNQLNAAPYLEALGHLSSLGLHKLKGPLPEFWSLDLNGPWRLLFRFRDGDAYDVHIADTH